MKIIERFKQEGPVFSFDFFPPKTTGEALSLKTSLRELKTLQPDFVSVTHPLDKGRR